MISQGLKKKYDMFTESTQKPTTSEHSILWTHKGAVKKFSGNLFNMPDNQQLATH